MEGKRAPAFSLVDDSGKPVQLSDFKGRTIVLYFYPKDDTPGCTKEACGFRDGFTAYKKKGAVILGVSPDDTKSHVKFKDKYSLPFPLLSDPDHKAAKAYGAFGKKKLYGREYEGIIRSTFVIAPDGKVAKAFSPVKVDGHSEQVLSAIDGIR